MTLLCPRCRVELQERPAHELVLKGCTRCGGVWLDNRGVARLGEALSHKTLAAVDALASAASHKGDEARPIDCPQCAEILVRMPISQAGVLIDRCPDHGAWYDRNELQQVARALGTKSAPRSAPLPPAKKAAPAQVPAAKVPQKSAAAPTQRPAKAPAEVLPKGPPVLPSKLEKNAGTVFDVAGLIIDVALSFFFK